MTLDTNVYATASQTLSCKIDKTAPVATATHYTSDYFYINYNDLQGSGVTTVKFSNPYISCTWNQFYSSILGTFSGTFSDERTVPNAPTEVNNNPTWTLGDSTCSIGNNRCTVRVDLILTDKAGNKSKYRLQKTGTDAPTASKL